MKFMQIKNEKDLIGKTISKVVYGDNNYFIFFTDNSFCIMAGCGWDEHDIEIVDNNYDLIPNENNIDMLFKIGVISDTKYRELFEEYRQDYNQRIIEKEKKLLEELKSKYEKI